LPPPEFVVASHRGPFVYERVGDGVAARRGGGGLIGSIGPVVEGSGVTWIAAPLSDTDREIASRGTALEEAGFNLRLLDLPRDQHELHYEVMSNEVFWFLFHYLFDGAYLPTFDGVFRDAWNAYREVNDHYAQAIASTPGKVVLVNDYQLMLAAASIRRVSRNRRPLVYFHHTPWCEPDYLSMLPEAVRQELVESMLAYDVVGFHARRWADAFMRCCERFIPGCVADGDGLSYKRRRTRVIVAPVPLDTERLVRDASADEVTSWVESHDALRAGRKLLLRVDRIDLSKNPLRGFLAFEQLLERRPALADEVLFLALIYPSRQTVERYQRYYSDCLGVVRRVNERFASEPIQLLFEDHYERSLGALRMYDALLVNPVFDGLNLVCKEGAVVNERSGSIVLSRNAGAFEELADGVVPVNPFDVLGTADAIEQALDAPDEARARNARKLRQAATRTTPAQWLQAQLDATR
jgi:trehalose 6-phosphate synthase